MAIEDSKDEQVKGYVLPSTVKEKLMAAGISSINIKSNSKLVNPTQEPESKESLVFVPYSELMLYQDANAKDAKKQKLNDFLQEATKAAQASKLNIWSDSVDRKYPASING